MTECDHIVGFVDFHDGENQNLSELLQASTLRAFVGRHWNLWQFCPTCGRDLFDGKEHKYEQRQT